MPTDDVVFHRGSRLDGRVDIVPDGGLTLSTARLLTDRRGDDRTEW